MIYALSIAATVIFLMFAIAWKHEVGGIYGRWRAARGRDGDRSDAPTRSEYLVAFVWTATFALFILFAIAVIWNVA